MCIRDSRNVFGAENVVEHHSNLQPDSNDERSPSRLATENWDAPIIVTTNVPVSYTHLDVYKRQAHVCHVNRIPFLSVRTVTDTSTHKGLENFEKNCEAASEISAGITLGILSLLERK